MVYIEGRLKTRKWQDEEGKDRYNTEVHCTEFTFLSPKGDSGNNADANPETETFLISIHLILDTEPPSLLLVTSINSELIISIIIMIILLICSALISGAEISFFSLTATDFEDESSDKELSANLTIVKKLLSKPKKLLATILVANNFINIAIVLLFASLGDQVFSGITTSYYGINLRFLLEVGIVTFIILLFGEILPKVYASRKSIQFSSFMALPLNFLDTILSPISRPMQSGIQFIEEKFRNQKSNISVDQLSQALELTSDEDKLNEDHKILQGIVTFGNTDTKQVMKPRMDIFALEETYVI